MNGSGPPLAGARERGDRLTVCGRARMNGGTMVPVRATIPKPRGPAARGRVRSWVAGTGSALRGRGRAPRAVLVLVSMLCLASHVGALLHLVLVRHQTCAEHGELVHAGHAGLPGAVTSLAEGTTRATAVTTGATSTELAEEDHCLVLAAAPAHGTCGPTETVVITDPPAVSEPSILPTWAPPARERLRLAPKTSPPAVTST